MVDMKGIDLHLSKYPIKVIDFPLNSLFFTC
jgi:hypothetical protein